MDKLCRLCLTAPKNPEELVNIFEDSSNLPVRIMACCSLEVQSSDALPKNICCDCRYQLDKTYIFRVKSKNAEARLKRHVRLINAGKPSHVFEEEEEVDEYEDALKFVQQHEGRLKQQEMWLVKSESINQMKRAKTIEKSLQMELQQVKEKLEAKTKEYSDLKRDLEELETANEMVAQEQGTCAQDDSEYYVEMLEDEPLDVKPSYDDETDPDQPMDTTDQSRKSTITTTKEEAGDDVAVRCECDPEEYAAIEKAVRVSSVAHNSQISSFTFYNFTTSLGNTSEPRRSRHQFTFSTAPGKNR